MRRKLISVVLALLMLAVSGLAVAGHGPRRGQGATCPAATKPGVCPCRAAQGHEAKGPCDCGEDAPCQVEAAPVAAHLETLPGHAWQPEPPAMGRFACPTAASSWVRLARVGDEAPWRPPKPLYLRHSSLLI